MKKTIVALTGASGAMGEEILYSLMHKNEDVYVCAFLRSYKKATPYLKKLLKKYKERIYTFYGDVTNLEDCKKLVSNADYVIHCAAVIPPKCDHNPKLAEKVNLGGTINMVDAICQSPRKDDIKFIHVSTMATYGNRTYPHVWGRVGDPMISADYDVYSLYKIKAERYVLESNLKNFISLRQTLVFHKYMFANNLKDGLLFHTAWNSPFESVTDRDSGDLLANLIERDSNGKLSDFWNKCYNVGGGENCRITGFDTVNDGFALLGKGAKDYFKPNWNVARNFAGVWFADSDVLEEKLNFRKENNADFWTRMGKKYWYFKFGKIVPAKLISWAIFKPLFKNTNAPKYWYNHKKDGRIKAFYGGYAEYEKMGENWNNFNLICEGKAPDGSVVDYKNLINLSWATENGLLLNHGYDESKTDDKLSLEDMRTAAAFRGGKCLSTEYIAGDMRQKLKWQCYFGHEFYATPYTVLKGGYWCPCCEPKPWSYGKIAKHSPFYAQVYYDTHDISEENDVYPLYEGEDDFIENLK
ncbi:MAG: NAD-dependent epimerase/dehydratase family protein [Clostridia bacterium]|nr:NAD-dependent epimerase/dehydratase family protein [Clostridia bacterium]